MMNKDLALGLSLGFSSVGNSGTVAGVPDYQPIPTGTEPWSFVNPRKVPITVHADSGGVERRFSGVIDVNNAPSTAEEASSLSSGKRREKQESDEDDGDISRKKLRLTKDQSAILEESFKGHSTLNPKQKVGLAKQLQLSPRQVEVWFQNRRARTKLKQIEVDCKFLKRCCESLAEENKRLLKEVQELRALKFSPQFFMKMTPATTLTMCQTCDRTHASSPPSSNKAGPQPISSWAHSEVAKPASFLPFQI